MAAGTVYSSGNRQNVIFAAVAAVSVVLLWLLPPVGFIACCVLLIVLPPWGRTITERALISIVVLLGLVALIFPRAGATPITATSAHLGLALAVLAVAAARFIPRLARPLPKLNVSDALIGIMLVGTSWWLMSAYVGRSLYGIVSGLFFSGWDNQGHFTTFANTYEIGSTTWPTIDGSVAWNQWYPALHTTMWSLAQLGSQTGAELLDRTSLLWPYVQWSSISFALCLAALAWVAGDLAGRLGPLVNPRSGFIKRWATPIAIVVFATFALLGSPTGLFNSGFTNFMMGVTVVVVTAYLSARDWHSARGLGWFLIPLGALAAIGLWTPLVLGLIPSGLIVALALWRVRKWLAPVWVIAAGGFVGITAWLQTQAVINSDPGTSAGGLLADLGAVGVGMSPFNIGAALAAPIVVLGLLLLLLRSHRAPLALAIAGPVLGFTVFAVIAMSGADGAELSRLVSYYVLKSLNAMLLAVAPLIAAMAAVGICLFLVGINKATRRAAQPKSARINVIIGGAIALVIGFTMFGYVGTTTQDFTGGFTSAPGVTAANARSAGVENDLIGESIISAQQAALPYPDKTTMLWDGSGTLPNLWVSALHGVMSKNQNTFYANLPPFPYDEKTLGHLRLSLNLDPSLHLVLLWFRGDSGVMVEELEIDQPDRVTTVKVPMRSSPLCEECSL